MQYFYRFSGAQNKGNNCCFPYKIPIVARFENYLNIMLNSQIFLELLALMLEASQWVLATKLLVVPELRTVRFESCDLPYKMVFCFTFFQ